MFSEQRELTLKGHNNLSLLKKGCKIFLIGGLYGLLLEAGHLNSLWFATSQP
jgi:preprotein translocase subunit YajC